MKRTAYILFAVACIFTGCNNGIKSDYAWGGVPFQNVHMHDGVLGSRISTVKDVTLPFAFRKCEETGRIDNFAKAAGLMDGDFVGLRFNDSDVFKVMEGASYVLAAEYDAGLDHYMDSLIALVGAAQEPDGYLYTIRTIGKPLHKAAGKERWSYIAQSHELYNVGHMYEAAVAHFQATGKRSFLDIAIRNADLLYKTFYEPKRAIASGHEEIELALVKLYRATGDERYLHLAKYFLDCRGHDPDGEEYNQNHMPVTEQTEAVGHAVRAVYMYMGMTDIAALMKDSDYTTAVNAIWEDVTGKKMYITGGIGSIWKGEAFGEPYYLPNDTAYCETCAAIANCMWNYRMFCMYGDSRYIDVLERSLYNNVLDGISHDGTKFFYPNVLECTEESIAIQTAAQVPPDKFSAARSEWFDCSCCPTNIVRFLPSIPGYIYATNRNELYVNLYASCDADISFGNYGNMKISQDTEYPWNGDIALTVNDAPTRRIKMKIRIPGWSRGKPVPSGLYHYTDSNPSEISISVNGNPASFDIDKGYACIDRQWKDGDRIDIHIPMEVRFVKADKQVEACIGQVAVERGPTVYCAEHIDNIHEISVSSDDRFDTVWSGLSGGCITLENTENNLKLIPYWARAERGLSRMSVYLKAE